MKEPLEVVKVDPQCMIVECNRIIDIIEIKRKELFQDEIKKVKNIFNMTTQEAEVFTHRMIPKNSVIYMYKQKEFELATKYLNKCIQKLDIPDLKLAILRKDYQMLTEFS